MTIDEAIEIYEIRANTHEREAEYHRPLGYSHEAIANVAEMDAREERQIAKWLKELKERRAEQTEPQYDFGAYSDRLWKIAYERGKREALEQTEPQKIGYCNECKWFRDKQVCGRCRSKNLYAPKTEPTISKMEQVDKDINVRSKDEPQTCSTCRFDNKAWYEPECDSCCDSNSNWQPKDEPQTERSE